MSTTSGISIDATANLNVFSSVDALLPNKNFSVQLKVEFAESRRMQFSLNDKVF